MCERASESVRPAGQRAQLHRCQVPKRADQHTLEMSAISALQSINSAQLSGVAAELVSAVVDVALRVPET